MYDFERDLLPYSDPWDDEPGDSLDVAREGSAQTTTAWKFHTLQYQAWSSAAKTKVLCVGRRAGKSELLARWALAGAMDDHLRGIAGITWVILPTYQMARPLFRKFLQAAPPGWITKTIGTETMPDMLQVGRARIEFKSGDHPERLVGEGLRRVVMDEAGLFKARLYSESILPALMDHDAPVLLAGTPKGKNWFYRLYAEGLDKASPGVATFKGPSSVNPFLPKGAIEKMRARMTERLFRQEVLAHFLDDDGAVFRTVGQCILPGGEYSKLPTVAIGVDLARKRDFTVIIGVDRQRRVTFLDRFRTMPWPQQKTRIRAAYEKLGKPKALIDATGVGDPVVQDLQQGGMIRARGFIFTPSSKAEIVEGLALEMEQGRVGLPDEPVLINELKAFEYTTTKGGLVRYGAPDGMKDDEEEYIHDDTVMSLALAVRCARTAGDSGVTI